jgi:MerR family redox-sensitive transcriptional activator SoxR
MTDDRPQMSIGEVARTIGVRPSAVRYWEGVGLLERPERVSGKRRYDGEALRRLKTIVRAKAAGFTLGEIRLILAGLSGNAAPSAIWRELATRKLPEVERTIDEAQSLKATLEVGLRCRCATIDRCLSSIA